MRGARRNMMQAAGRHFLDPCLARFVHQDQSARTKDGGIEFGAVGFVMKMAVSHEIFAADPAGLDDGVAPRKAALRTFRDWRPPLDAVDERVRRHFIRSSAVVEKVFDFAERLATLANFGAVESAS